MADVITTAAELDALPHGAIVRREYPDGSASVYVRRAEAHWPHGWEAPHDDSGPYSSEIILGPDQVPLTLVFRPDRDAVLEARKAAFADAAHAFGHAADAWDLDTDAPDRTRLILGGGYREAERALLAWAEDPSRLGGHIARHEREEAGRG